MNRDHKPTVSLPWVFLTLILGAGMLAPPTPALSQAAENGYWIFLRTETPPDTWVGSDFRGMPATWQPFYEDDSIGGVYQETTSAGAGKEIVWLTEKATCVWTWGEDMPAQRLDPLDPLHVVATADASAEGPGTVFSGAITTINYGPANAPKELKTVAFAQANIDKTSSNPATAIKEQEGMLNVPPGSTDGELMAFELNCSVGNGLGKVSTRWIYQWKVEKVSLPPAPNTPIPTIAPTQRIITPGPTPTNCPVLTPAEKLRRILAEYHRKIEPGIHPIGVTNNLVSIYSSRMDKWTCGSYQRMVLALLNSIRFNKNPCIASLMDGWDYGPIQAFYGGHQAVVIYPSGKDWITDGIVLDPWIRQTPKAYSIASWSNMMSLGLRLVGKNPGIGPSTFSDTDYPTHGQQYVNPSGGLSKSEKTYVGQQSDVWRKKFYNMNVTEQKQYLDRIRQRKIRGTRVIAHCPLEFYVQDATGAKTGRVNGQFVNDLAGVTYLSLPLEDGTFWTQIEYDPDLKLSLVMQGTGKGPAELFVGLSQYNEDPALDKSEAFHLDVSGGQVLTLKVAENTMIESNGQEYGPVIMDEQKAAQLAGNLSQPDLSMLEEVYSDTEDTTQTATIDTRTRLLLGGAVCCMALFGLLAAGGIGFYFLRRKK